MKQRTTGEWIAITLAVIIVIAVFLLAGFFFAPQSQPQPVPAEFSAEALPTDGDTGPLGLDSGSPVTQ